jgi:hypothetical protein
LIQTLVLWSNSSNLRDKLLKQKNKGKLKSLKNTSKLNNKINKV